MADFLQNLFSGLTLWFEASKLEVEVDPSQGKIKHHNHTQNHQKKSFQDLNEAELNKIEERIGFRKFIFRKIMALRSLRPLSLKKRIHLKISKTSSSFERHMSPNGPPSSQRVFRNCTISFLFSKYLI